MHMKVIFFKRETQTNPYLYVVSQKTTFSDNYTLVWGFSMKSGLGRHIDYVALVESTAA